MSEPGDDIRDVIGQMYFIMNTFVVSREEALMIMIILLLQGRGQT